MVDISEKIEFSRVTKHLESLQKAANHPAKCEILKNYYNLFQEFRKTFRQSNPECSVESTTFYPVLRLLLPDADHERPAYGIKTTTLGKLLVRILAIDPQSQVAKRLMRKDEPSGGSAKTGNSDYASVVYEVMKNRASTTCQLTVYDVNERLDNIARNNVDGDKRKDTEDQLIALFQGLTAIDQKWLIRIILKNVRTGLGQHKLLALLRSDANDLFACHNSLKMLCISLESDASSHQPSTSSIPSTSSASAPSVSPGHPFLPMLCAPIQIQKVENLIGTDDFFLETKMDGERFQMHFINERFHYFSRRGHDYTAQFGADTNSGSLTPDLYDMFKIPVSNCILDGEMMVWNRQEGVYKIKAENTDVKSLPRSHGTLRPLFCAFDVLLLNGVCLMHKPYAERIRLLETLIRPKIGVVNINRAERIRDSEHIVECVNRAFDNREEGVVIKKAESTYCPGEKFRGWFKIKPDYIDGMITELDLIVLGGYLDRSKTFLTKFQVGVYDKLPDSELGKFYACTNVNAGLTDRQMTAINEQLRPHWNAVRRPAARSVDNRPAANHPPMINFGTDLPDIWIDPRNSVIFEIKASELTKSKSFATSYSLRFPRIKLVRSDKAWYDCCTLNELMNLCVEDRTVQKLTKRQLETADIRSGGGDSTIPIRAKRLRGRLPKTADTSLSNTANISSACVVIDTICKGLNFCVLNTNKNNGPTVQELEQMIRAHAGNVLANQTSSTFVCIATAVGQQSLRVAALCRARTHNIASVEWLIGALGGDTVRSQLNDFQPSDMICCTPELERKFQTRFDVYGDSYTEQLDEGGLRRILDKMDIENLPQISRSEIHELERQLDPTTKSGNYFRLATAHFADAVPTWVRSIFEWHGGRSIDRASVMDSTKRSDFQLSHAIVDADSEADVTTAGDWAAKRCVSYAWIVDSHGAGKKMSEKKYAVELKLLEP